jgi:hypothetical protein
MPPTLVGAQAGSPEWSLRLASAVLSDAHPRIEVRATRIGDQQVVTVPPPPRVTVKLDEAVFELDCMLILFPSNALDWACRGRLDISGYAQHAMVAATIGLANGNGETASAEQVLTVALPPRVDVKEPAAWAPQSGSVHVVAECQGVEPGGCGVAIASQTAVALDAGMRLERDVPLSSYSPAENLIALDAVSATGIRTRVTWPVVVDPPTGALFQVRERVDGKLIAADARRILFTRGGEQALLLDRQTRAVSSLMAPDPFGDDIRLCPEGALLNAFSWDSSPIAWTDDSVKRLRPPTQGQRSFRAISPSGRFSLWSYQELTACPYELVDSQGGAVRVEAPFCERYAAATVNDAGHSYVFSSNRGLYHFTPDGRVAAVARTKETPLHEFAGHDGELLLFTNLYQTGQFAGRAAELELMLRSGNDETVLARGLLRHPDDLGLMSARGYALNAALRGGWVAFVDPWERRVKVRSPEGVLTSVLSISESETYSNNPPFEPTKIEAIGATGEILLQRTGRRVWVAPGELPVDLMRGGVGRAFWIDGSFAVALGNTLYDIDPRASAGPIDAGTPVADDAGIVGEDSGWLDAATTDSGQAWQPEDASGGKFLDAAVSPPPGTSGSARAEQHGGCALVPHRGWTWLLLTMAALLRGRRARATSRLKRS